MTADEADPAPSGSAPLALSVASIRLADAYLRVDRSDEHRADLERRAGAFASEHIDKVTAHIDPVRGVGLRNEVPAPPRILSVIVGEALYNLRAALDYLVYAVAWLDSGEHNSRTQFPIESTPDGFRGRRDSYLAGVGPAHVDAIEELQPYNDVAWLAALRDLNNRDKHWAMNLATASGSGTFTFSRTAEGDVTTQHDGTIAITFEEGPLITEVLGQLAGHVRAVLDAFAVDFPAHANG